MATNSMDRLQKHYLGIILSILGLLYGLGFSDSRLWFLCLPYPLLLAYAWVEKPLTSRLKLYTWFSGWILMLSATSWMLELNPGAWTLPSDFELKTFIGLIWVLGGLVWSTGFVILPLTYKYLSTLTKKTELRYLLFCVAFILSEWFRSVFFSVAHYGDGASVGANWSFGAFGLAMTDTPLLFASRIVGLFGLSFVGLSMLYGSLLIAKKSRSKVSFCMVVIPILIASAGYLLPTNMRSFSYDVTLVHKPYAEGTTQTISTDIPTGYSPSVEQKQLVILPEYSGIFQDGLDENDKKFVQTLSGSTPTTFVDVISTYDAENRYNQLVVSSSDGTQLDSQYKKLLIPGGEYLPYYMKALLYIGKNGGISQNFDSTSQVTKASTEPRIITLDDESIGALACSSIISPDNYRKLVKDGADLLINSADLGVFRDAKSYHSQNIQYAKFISASNSRPYTQAAKQGVSIVANVDGEVVDHLETFSNLEVRSYQLNTNDKLTPYTLLGEWFIPIGLLLCVYAVTTQFTKNKKT